MAFAILDIKHLGVRRFKLCQMFAKKTLNSRQHANLFRINHNFYDTRHRSESFTNRCNIWRYFKSPVIYLTRILNNEEESWNITDCNGYKATFALCTECVHQTVLPVFTNIGSESDYVYYYYSGNVIKPLIAMMQWFKIVRFTF